jgi:hypothetical protein
MEQLLVAGCLLVVEQPFNVLMKIVKVAGLRFI